MPSTSHIPDPVNPGTLYVVATPIGHMADITLRALSVLKGVDLVAAEDTRTTRRLFAAYDIPTPLISYHEHNELKRAEELVAKMQGGASIGLVSDAGTPTLSDPGYRLVVAALSQGLAVVPIPGVSAAITALSVAGFPTDSFVFEGFPDRGKGKREKTLQALSGDRRTLIFYESPRRVEAFLAEIRSVMGDRSVVLAREMTKQYEEYIRGTVSEVLAVLSGRDQVKGECTLLVAGATGEASVSEETLRTELQAALATGESLKEVSRRLSEKYGLSRQAVYGEGLRAKEMGEEK